MPCASSPRASTQHTGAESVQERQPGAVDITGRQARGAARSAALDQVCPGEHVASGGHAPMAQLVTADPVQEVGHGHAKRQRTQPHVCPEVMVGDGGQVSRGDRAGTPDLRETVP